MSLNHSVWGRLRCLGRYTPALIRLLQPRGISGFFNLRVDESRRYVAVSFRSLLRQWTRNDERHLLKWTFEGETRDATLRCRPSKGRHRRNLFNHKKVTRVQRHSLRLILPNATNVTSYSLPYDFYQRSSTTPATRQDNDNQQKKTYSRPSMSASGKSRGGAQRPRGRHVLNIIFTITTTTGRRERRSGRNTAVSGTKESKMRVMMRRTRRNGRVM